MRLNLMAVLSTLAFVTGVSAASASSLMVMGGTQSNPLSIRALHCEACPPLVKKQKKSSYLVPKLESGPQQTEIREINGEPKLVRTENWMGGSPVVIISNVPKWMSDSSMLAESPKEHDGIDVQATTAAVKLAERVADAPVENAATPEIAVATEPKPLDTETFALRLK